MIRLTGILLFIHLSIWLILFERKKGTYSKIIWFIIGVAIAPLFFLAFFTANNVLLEMLYWVTEPLMGFREYVVVSLPQKGMWLIQTLSATAPLWCLSVIGIALKRDRFSTLLLRITARALHTGGIWLFKHFSNKRR